MVIGLECEIVWRMSGLKVDVSDVVLSSKRQREKREGVMSCKTKKGVSSRRRPNGVPRLQTEPLVVYATTDRRGQPINT